MKRSGFILLASVCALSARGADATSPIDYTQRNSPYAPDAAKVAPGKQVPQGNAAIQDKRVPATTVEKQIAPLADDRTGIEVKETREKNVREKKSHRPEANTQPTSAFNHKSAAITTAGDTTKPPMVAKYQDSLSAANLVKTGKLSALESATTAKMNRFVFRKNPPDPLLGPGGATVTPAGGGAAVKK